jgi:hypothetical protein
LNRVRAREIALLFGFSVADTWSHWRDAVQKNESINLFKPRGSDVGEQGRILNPALNAA